MSDPSATFSLIVCTLGRLQALERLLASLSRQVLRPFEVVIVDQNAPGFLAPVLDRYRRVLPIQVVRSAPGLSRARNVGLRHARGGFIAFPDDDCWYRERTLEHAHAHLERHPEVSMVAGQTLDCADRPSVSPFLHAPASISRRNFLRCGNSNCLFWRRDAVARIGGFDERLGVGAATPFQSGEEADLILRALAGGLLLHFTPDLIVHHDQVDTTIAEAQILRARRYGAGFGALLRKHDFAKSYVLYRLARPMLGAARSVLGVDPVQARYKSAWARGIFEGYWGWTGCTEAPSRRAHARRIPASR